jgi:general secretion pathway protein I
MRNSKGFTLIEVLIAAIIVLSGTMVVANAWSGNLMRLEKAGINDTMATLLQRKMTEVELQYKDKAVTEIPEEDAGDFGPAYPQYKWELKSKEFEMPNIADQLISREGGADQNLITLITQMTELMGKAIKEVAVTVTYTSKRNKGEVKNSVATYFIDYSVPLPFGGGGGGDTGGGGAGGGGAGGGGGK